MRTSLKAQPAPENRTWKITDVLIEKLKPAPYNPREMSAEEMQALKRSMMEWGCVDPIIVQRSSNLVIGGHQRLTAAQELGWKKLPAVYIDITDTSAKALNVALNKIGGHFDEKKLREVLQDLGKEDLDLSITGFNEADLKKLFAEPPKIEQEPGPTDEPPPPPAKPRTKPGDLWVLGEHRVLCADATVAKNLARLMGSARAAMVHTEPPYSIAVQTGKAKPPKECELVKKIFIPALRLAVQHTTDTAAFYLWHASSTREDLAYAMKVVGLIEKQYLIWDKGQIMLGQADYQSAHEPCFYAGKDGEEIAFHGDRAQATIWNINATTEKAVITAIGKGVQVVDGEGGRLTILPLNKTKQKLRVIRLETGQVLQLSESGAHSTVWKVQRDNDPEHPTQKPVALAQRAIDNSSQPGEIVLDQFLGSGSTLMAAEFSGRRCFGLETEPRHCDQVVRRWEQFTGENAQRQ